MSPLPWSLRSTLNMPSPDSSPTSLPHGSHDVMDDEDDMFFEPCEPPETSFVFSVTEGTPSPRSKKVQEMLPSKYKPRDSGVAFSDDEDTSNSGGNFLSAMPRTSTSASSLNSDAGDDLVTPGVVPGANSDWPTAVILSGLDDSGRNFHRTNDDGVDVDVFILQTLTTSSEPSAEDSKKPPTPLKDWPPEWTQKNNQLFAMKYFGRSIIALEFITIYDSDEARFLAAYPQAARGHTALLHAINVARRERGERPSRERHDHEP
ncbi:hypothetical protein PAXRUDRAFT_19624 [Paxillus rubicundulus Ve08.2h10]|uniref:Uncharacterized protein n=1 Tax=Paxillus rubicundulus Ve08.2h10 TaxID=930991 RepID=A0A0D0DBQ7_9AGAM|nr:hypothetical protein PAXRUDRAFT_19624 [Paxillus rubicundulus Ve08.2h10]